MVPFLAALLAGAGASPARQAEVPDPAEEEGSPDLADLSLEDLMEVEIVTASKALESVAEAPATVTVITADEIRDFGGLDLFEILDRAPGVFMAGSYFIPQNVGSIRRDLPSHNDNHVLLLIDGRPFRDFTQGGFSRPLYLAFPVEVIQRIELIRGPGSVLYGTNAFSGVINVITKASTELPGYRAAAGVGSYEARGAAVAAGHRRGAFDFVGALRGFEEDGWRLRAVDEFGVASSTRYGEEELGLHARLAYKKMAVSAFVATADETHLGPRPVWPAGRLEEDRYFFDLGHEAAVARTWSLETHLTYNRSAFEFPFDPVPPPLVPLVGVDPPIDNESESTLLEVTARSRPGERRSFTLGAIADYRTGETRSPLEGFSTIPAYDELAWSAYGQVDWRLSTQVKLVAGLQWHRAEDTDADVVPRAAVIFELAPRWGGKLLYGEAFRAPTELETSLLAAPELVGNPALEPEKVATVEAQVFFHREEAQLALTYFHSDQRGLIARVPSEPVDTFANIDHVVFEGLELEGKYSFSPATYVMGSVSRADDRNKAGDEPVSAVSETMIKVGLAHRWRAGHGVGLFDTHFSEPSNVTGLSGPNPDPTAVDLLTANVRLNLTRLLARDGGPQVLLEIHGTNLLDEEVMFPEYVRREINALPSRSGAAVYGQVEIRF